MVDVVCILKDYLVKHLLKTSLSVSEIPIRIEKNKSSVQRVPSDPVKLLTDSLMNFHCLKEPVPLLRGSIDSDSSLDDCEFETSSIDDEDQERITTSISDIDDLDSMMSSINDVEDNQMRLLISFSDIDDKERMLISWVSDIDDVKRTTSMSDLGDYIQVKASMSDNEETKTSISERWGLR